MKISWFVPKCWIFVAPLFLFSFSGLSPGLRAADYFKDVKPALQARCYSCHGALKQNGGLRLDTAEAIRKGGDSGPAAEPGRSGESLLVDRIAAEESDRMPPAGEGESLKPEQIAAIRAWIDAGAPIPPDEKPEPDPRDHWSFRPPVAQAVPTVKNAGLVRNPIDAFLVAKQEELGLTQAPAADKGLLLRRVSLDLIGLPPTLDELEAFVNDPAPDAYEKAVDRLLNSPRHGERWGRHWMDIWRYSDWWGLGAEVRNSQKHIWHWRDWIIESVNADKGYDQMVREMLAADELYPNDLDRLRASGYLARQYFKFNRTSWLDETIEHTSKAFLGVTFNCAKCHDHKYDPIAQTDYYRLRAFFEPYQVRTEQLPGETDLEKDGLPRAFDCDLDRPTYLFRRGNDQDPIKDRPLSPGLPAFLSAKPLPIHPVPLPTESRQPGLRPFVLENALRDAQKTLDAAKRSRHDVDATSASKKWTAQQLEAAQDAADKRLHAAEQAMRTIRARAAADRARTPETAKAAALEEKRLAVLAAEADAAQAELDSRNADPAKKADVEKTLKAARDKLTAARKALENPGESYASLSGALKTLESNIETEESRRKPFPAVSSGRRTALAEWMTDRHNPFTARVAVNHIWSRHFGRPLIPTVFDLGRKGTAPTHPELLDYLAVELPRHDWSMKWLHRLIVTSQAYRLSGSMANATAENLARDPENRRLWRRQAIRMEAQLARDGLLRLAGELDLTMGGPPIPANDENSKRRSLYFFHSHNDYEKFLAIFDDAGVLECYRRSESIVPQQALALSNSKLAQTAAAKIAVNLSAGANNDDDAFVKSAWRLMLCRTPTPEESAACREAIGRYRESARQRKLSDADSSKLARTGIVHALLNHNDFITIR